MHMQSRSLGDCGKAFTYHSAIDAARRTSDRIGKEFYLLETHRADERTSKAEETQKEVVRIVSHYLLSHNIGTHIDIAAARLSTLLFSTQRKPNYMALPDDNMIDGRWDSTLRDDGVYVLKNTTHGSLQGPWDLLRNSRVSWTATKTTSV